MKRAFILLITFVLMFTAISFAAAEDQYGWVNADTTLRMSASDAAVQSGTVKYGTNITILEETSDENGVSWYRVEGVKEDFTGWVHSDDVDQVIAKKSIASAESASAGTIVANGTKVTNEKDWPVLTASGRLTQDQLRTEMDLMQYHDLEMGATGDEVEKVLARLDELGYGYSATSKYDTNNQRYIKKFQKINGLEEDGQLTAELQLLLFSDKALNPKGKTVVSDDALLFKKVTVKSSSGTTLKLEMKNTTDTDIDAFRLVFIMYDAYGKRYCWMDSVTDEIDLLVMGMESEKVTKKQPFAMSCTITDKVYFAGGYVCVLSYHTADGETVEIPEDQRHWFGYGKGVTNGYIEPKVTALTFTEKTLSDEWNLGISGVYVDDEYAEEYKLREGTLVLTMDKGSAMDAAGIEAGDVILVIGDYRIFGVTSLKRAAANVNAGDSVPMLYWRNGSVYVTTLSRPSEDAGI